MDHTLELKWADKGECLDCLRVWQKVYSPEVFADDWGTPAEFQRFLIGRVDGQVAFAAVICDYPTYVRGQVLDCAGIAAVGTLPEFRGLGTGQAMMDATMGLIREAGYQIAALYAFRESFYRKSGFEASGWRWQIKCPIHQLPKVECTLPIREVAPEDIRCVEECYLKFAQRFNGSCARLGPHWVRRLGKKPSQIYAVGDPVEGYLWCNPHGFWNDLEIGEIAWSSSRGYESLLALMRTLGINKSNAVWSEPPESGFARRFLDGNVEMARHRPTMFAVVDAQSTLARMGADFNQFSLEFMGETVGTGPQVDLNHLQLAQAVMGSPSLAEMVRWGEVGGDDRALDYLQTILNPMPVCCMEFF